MKTSASTLWCLKIAAFITFGTVALGAVVCATYSSAACPNWPGCYFGQILPRGELNPIIEFTHRVFAMSTLPALLVAAVMARKHPLRVVRVLPWFAVAGALGAGIFGMFTIKTGLTPIQGMADLWCALMSLVTIVITLVAARRVEREQNRRIAQLAYGVLGGLFVLHGLGVLTAAAGSYTRCMGWPLWLVNDMDKMPALQLARVGLAVIILAGIGVLAWRTKTILPLAMLLAVELILGVIIRVTGLNGLLGSLYGITAVTIVATVAWVAGRYRL